ncbi:protein phosphatase CheZ [Hydrogenophaga sp.]|uniref:protein phosphatase CheZ n=1 Tax=Hydrogenophaga sp. TaxID=1904254 RepID=UPI0027212394|nr:protein phosphatase CheZ [Hydrogenophaga sp.]MDO9437951.1 protein phosphatase CheZ [Hydrogenophaga sp.]
MQEEHTNPEDAAAGNPDMFRQLGSITRQLHEALKQLGYTDKLKGTVDQLPDAQSRLSYIARLTGEAAEKVLNHVDEGKAEQARIAERGRQLADTIGRVPGLARAMPELLEWSKDIVDLSEKSDARLTDIMMAQDFHDLTGQVIGRVVQLAGTIEEQLLGLLLQAAPAGQPGQDHAIAEPALAGPVVNPEGRSDVVSDQKQVDDLLASLGF